MTAYSVNTMFSKIQYISQGKTAIEQEKNINNVLKYGADWIQLRWKQGDEVQLLALAIRVQKKCIQYGTTLIINDHVAIAKTIDADGVHLGLTDTSIQEARELLGPDKIIGGTANNLTDVKQRIVENCDYIGLGPLRFTKTKEKLSPILGLNGYQEIVKLLKKEAIAYPPLYAIGGVSLEDIIQLQEAGLYGVAVSSLLSEQPDLIQEFKNKLQWTI